MTGALGAGRFLRAVSVAPDHRPKVTARGRQVRRTSATSVHAVAIAVLTLSLACDSAAKRSVIPPSDVALDQKGWLCLAQKRMIPTIVNLTQARQIFKTLAARYRGKYDGWKAAVEP